MRYASSQQGPHHRDTVTICALEAIAGVTAFEATAFLARIATCCGVLLRQDRKTSGGETEVSQVVEKVGWKQRSLGVCETLVHTFATACLVLVATCGRSDAYLAWVAAITLRNDAETA
jgi:hypothetical protein